MKHGRDFNLALKRAPSPLPAIKVHDGNTSYPFQYDRTLVYSGHLKGLRGLNAIVHDTGFEADSEAFIVISEEGVLGTIHDHRNKHTYFIEDANSWYTRPTFSNVIYRLADLSFNISESLHRPYEGEEYARMRDTQVLSIGNNGIYLCISPDFLNIGLLKMIVLASNGHRVRLKHLSTQAQIEALKAHFVHPHHTEWMRAVFDKTLHNTCELAIVADFLFYTNSGQSSVSFTTSLILAWVNAITVIFKSTAFTGVGLGIQFAIAQITIYSNANNVYGTTETNVNNILNIASQGDPFLGSWNSVCVAHVLTHRTFDDGILGLAWVGSSAAGICARGTPFAGNSLNCGVSTSQNFGTTVPAIVSIITMAHEIGHNFGSTVTLLGDFSNIITKLLKIF